MKEAAGVGSAHAGVFGRVDAACALYAVGVVFGQRFHGGHAARGGREIALGGKCLRQAQTGARRVQKDTAAVFDETRGDAGDADLFVVVLLIAKRQGPVDKLGIDVRCAAALALHQTLFFEGRQVASYGCLAGVRQARQLLNR